MVATLTPAARRAGQRSNNPRVQEMGRKRVAWRCVLLQCKCALRCNVFVLPPVFDVVTLSVHVSAGDAAARGHGAAADLSTVRRDMSGRAGAVHLMMQLHSLPASMAHDSFDMHTAYLVPGSRAVAAEDVGADGVGTVLMWSSFNLALNWYRAYIWYRKENLGVVFGADHTYKFDAEGTAHLTLIMIA